MIKITDLEKTYRTEEVETIAGLVAHNLERMPEVGDIVKTVGVDREGDEVTVALKVLRMDGRRVDRLLLTRLPGIREEDSV